MSFVKCYSVITEVSSEIQELREDPETMRYNSLRSTYLSKISHNISVLPNEHLIQKVMYVSSL